MHSENYSVYGARKVYAGCKVARCTVGPLVVGEDGPEVLHRRRLGKIIESLVRELDLSVSD